MYDYLLVGCGLFNATFCRCAIDAGRRVLMIDKRSHIGGNCYDETVEGINVHKYGPHQFHTKSPEIWEFVNQFAEFNHYRAHIKANYGERIYSMPPNMMLYHQLWGVNTPEEARKHIEAVRVPCKNSRNLKDMVCNAVGEEIYLKFYYGYSKKQWGVDPAEIPVSVGRRLPIRFTWTDRWFDDQYEGIPKGGYTQMIGNMIEGATIILNVDFFQDKGMLTRMAKKVVYSGKIDEYFEYCFGDLEYRSLRFEQSVVDGDFQGNAIVNYTSEKQPYTRITEHKHFDFTKSKKSVITKEFSEAGDRDKVPFYPVRNAKNDDIYQQYSKLATTTDVVFGGRLGSFCYYDMDQTIAQGLAMARQENILP